MTLFSSAASSVMRLASSCAVANAFTTCAVGLVQIIGCLRVEPSKSKGRGAGVHALTCFDDLLLGTSLCLD